MFQFAAQQVDRGAELPAVPEPGRQVDQLGQAEQQGMGAGRIRWYAPHKVIVTGPSPVDGSGRSWGSLGSQAFAPGGMIISVSVPVDAPSTVAASHMVMRNDPQDLAALVKLVDAGVVTVDVTESYPLADMAEVHRRSAAGLIHGKVVLRP